MTGVFKLISIYLSFEEFMMTIKFMVEQNLTFNQENDISDSIADVLTEFNYKVIDKMDDFVSFISHGPKPVSKSEAVLYIKQGQFEVLIEGNKKMLRLTYLIDYSGEIMLSIFVIFSGLFVNHMAFLSIIVIILYFFYRLYKINQNANELMFAVL